jgi:hypothetical protein
VFIEKMCVWSVEKEKKGVFGVIEKSKKEERKGN